MRAPPYGPGDVIDRLSVLTLKIYHKGERYEREFAVLTRNAKGIVEGPDRLDALALAAINGELWGHEDQIRRFREQLTAADRMDPDPRDVARIAIEIQELNDRRQELVTRLNGDRS